MNKYDIMAELANYIIYKVNEGEIGQYLKGREWWLGTQIITTDDGKYQQNDLEIGIYYENQWEPIGSWYGLQVKEVVDIDIDYTLKEIDRKNK